MIFDDTVNPVQYGHSQKDRKLVFKTSHRLMQVKSIAECSKGSILQYFRPSLRYHLSSRSLFCLFWSGCFTKVLLYLQCVLVFNFISIRTAKSVSLDQTAPCRLGQYSLLCLLSTLDISSREMTTLSK